MNRLLRSGPGSPIWPICEELAIANHILYARGVLDGFGHVSARHPERGDLFLLSRNKAPALVEPGDILTLDLDGEVVDRDDAGSFLERHIHAGIYRARSDVTAVVHSHALPVLPFGLGVGLDLRPVTHMSGFLRPSTPVFEIRDQAGEGTDMLVRTKELGTALAGCLGDHPVVLMRGHGMTVVGQSVREAVFRSVYATSNAQVQATASGFGVPTGLTAEEAEAADRSNRTQVDRAWDFWRLEAASLVRGLRDAQRELMTRDRESISAEHSHG